MSLTAVVPDGVVVQECFRDSTLRVLPEEAAAVSGATRGRRAEFATTRQCARRALRLLGVDPVPIPTGRDRRPLWPPGVLGSLTHCSGYRGSALCRSGTLTALGVDAEPHRPPPPDVAAMFGRPDERAAVARADPHVDPDCLLFSAKEAVYKAWNPITDRWLGFLDVTVTVTPTPDRTPTGTFVAEIAAEPGEPGRLAGRYAVADGLLFTAAWQATLQS